MSTMKLMTPIEYCTEEVERQGHDVLVLDGISRVGWMLNAWEYAIIEAVEQLRTYPTITDTINIGHLVEKRTNAGGMRTCDVRVGDRICPSPKRLNTLLVSLFESLREGNYKGCPLIFYRDFEIIHPFEDGNGRTGKVLLNWVNGSLLRPIFPPKNLWGHPIRNP